jgi:hypothetical protein
MRYLQLMILVLSCTFGTPVFADLCCPSGCVLSGYGNGCWHIGTNNSCGPASTCGGSASGGGGGGGGTGGGGIYPQRAPCTVWYQTQQNRDDATNQCVSVLTTNAQFWGCLFEDNAGRAEDQRTGLSCADRQAALAKQCRPRCATYVQSMTTCSGGADGGWQTTFGDIGGSTYGSARVDLCGPRLKTSFFNRVGRSRPPRLTP